jgi:hypothetical protein
VPGFCEFGSWITLSLAAWGPILESHVEVGFQSFYSEFFEKGGDIDAAITALQRKLDPCPLMFCSSKHYFKLGALKYVEEHCIGPGFDARVESLADRAAAVSPHLQITRKTVRQVLAREVENTPAFLRRKARMFLHMDTRPENNERFESYVEALLKQVEELLGGGASRH